VLALVVTACGRGAQAPKQRSAARDAGGPATTAPSAAVASAKSTSAPRASAAPTTSTQAESPATDPTQQPACTLEPRAPAGPEAEALFILVGDETGAGATYWVQRQGQAVRWLGWSENVIFAWNGGVWRAGSEHHEQKTAGCQADSGVAQEPGTATLEHLVLLRLDAPGRIEPLGPPRVPHATREASSESRVIGLVGPYLYALTSAFTDDCGAHGNGSVTVRLVHLDTRKSPKLTLPPTIEAKAKKQALAYQKEMEDPNPLRMRWETMLPNFDRGKLTANFVFVSDTNYGASSWGSYQHAEFVEGPPPQELASHASAPALVTTLKCGSGHVVGFTQAPPGAAEHDAIKRAFQRPSSGPAPSAGSD